MQSDAEIWQQWLQWLPTAPLLDRPASAFAQYRAERMRNGVSEAEANAQSAIISRMMRAETDGWRVLFNNIYSSPHPGFKTLPNALLMSATAGRPAGRALDVSTGQGRNAVFLALQGWEVTATDISDGGLEATAQNGGRAGVHISTILQSNDNLNLGLAEWDLIVLTYVPVPLTSPDYVVRLHEALRPGGLVVVESFASNADALGRRPVDIDPADLRQAFAGLQLLHFEDVTTMPDWENKETRLVRLIAEK